MHLIGMASQHGGTQRGNNQINLVIFHHESFINTYVGQEQIMSSQKIME
jgi:hypothetical protein